MTDISAPSAEAYYAGKTYYDLVKEFHELFGHPVGSEDNPQALDVKRQIARMEWMIEEVIEFMSSSSLVNQVDGMIDLLYFILGCHVEMGAPIEVSFLNVDDRSEFFPVLPNAMERLERLENCRDLSKLIFHYGRLATFDEQYSCLATLGQRVMDVFSQLGCHPKGLFEVAHEANLSKMWPDRTVKYDPITGKILKSPSWEPPEPIMKSIIRKRVREYYKHMEKEEAVEDARDREEGEIPF